MTDFEVSMAMSDADADGNGAIELDALGRRYVRSVPGFITCICVDLPDLQSMAKEILRALAIRRC